MGHITNSVKYFGSFLTFVHAVVCVTIWGRDRRSHSLRGPVVGGAHRLPGSAVAAALSPQR